MLHLPWSAVLLSVKTKYTCEYKDGTLVEGLTFDESYSLFKEAFSTDNACSVYPTREKSIDCL